MIICGRSRASRTLRATFGLAVGVFVVSSSAFSQPTCDDDAVLQQVVATYFGLSEYRGMTDAQIREKITAAPQMKHWRDMAKENEVGEAIANWVINIDVQATVSAQHLVRSITAIPRFYDPNSKMYTCQATPEFDNEKLIRYLTLETLNSWLYSANGIRDLDAGSSMNEMGKWRAMEHFLSDRLRQIAERIASCVRRRITFTVQPSKSNFTIELDPMPAYDQDCVMTSSTSR